MYRGFNLKLNLKENEFYYKVGLKLNENFRVEVKKKLDGFILENGTLSASSIMDDWFPQINSHIFLSHSHRDEKLALTLAGWLYKKLNIRTFIDSTIWGYSNDLLKKINDKYCYNYETRTYNYEKLNNSSIHINLMLSNALNKMIDNCECILFLNTPNSISSEEAISKTYSPWIFSEITTTQIIHKKTPNRLKLQTKMFSADIQLNEHKRSELLIEYDLELAHLTDLNFNDIGNWISSNGNIPIEPLDTLYKQHPLNKKFKI